MHSRRWEFLSNMHVHHRRRWCGVDRTHWSMQQTPRTAPRHWFVSHTSIDIIMVLAPPVDWSFRIQSEVCVHTVERDRGWWDKINYLSQQLLSSTSWIKLVDFVPATTCRQNSTSSRQLVLHTITVKTSCSELVEFFLQVVAGTKSTSLIQLVELRSCCDN